MQTTYTTISLEGLKAVAVASSPKKAGKYWREFPHASIAYNLLAKCATRWVMGEPVIHLSNDKREMAVKVWIDIPGDIQLAEMPETYEQFQPFVNFVYYKFQEVRDAIARAERPLILAGYGIRQSGTVDEFVKFIEKWNIPFVSTYGARDYTADSHRLSIGAIGQRGSRAGNFAVQNADLLLILGSSLNASVVGYDPNQFAPTAYKIMIDYDLSELNKDIVKIDQKVPVQLTEFFIGMDL